MSTGTSLVGSTLINASGNTLRNTNAAGGATLVPGFQVARIDSTRNLVDDNSTQAIFPTTDDALTLIAGATYGFSLILFATKGVNVTNTFGSFGGTATFTSFHYLSVGSQAASNAGAAAAQNNGNDATTAIVWAASAAAANIRVILDGIFEVNAVGTLIPQIAFQAVTGSTPTIAIDTTFTCWLLGSNPVTTIGPWA